jgi:hypothetical protein
VRAWGPRMVKSVDQECFALKVPRRRLRKSRRIDRVSHSRALGVYVGHSRAPSLTKIPKDQQEDQYQRLLRGIRDDEGRRHKRTRLQRLAKDAHELGAKLRKLEGMKCIVLVSKDFEEILEGTLEVPRGVTLRTRRALAEAIARGYADHAETPDLEPG